MNSELKAKWVAALKGGQYPQGQQQLKSASGEYCCLGVLAEVAGVELLQGECIEGDEGDEYQGYARLGDTISTGEEILGPVARVLGIAPSVEEKLMELNAGKPDEAQPAWSFEEIAQWIETHNLKTGELLSEGEPQE